MPSHLHADRSAQQPPDRGALDALITQARRLRGGIDAMRPGDPGEFDDDALREGDSQTRWQRALFDLAAHQLDDLGGHLDQLRESTSAHCPAVADGLSGPAAEATESATGPEVTDDDPRALRSDGTPAAAYGPGGRPSQAGRAGSADWNLLTDEVSWSDELYAIFGREPEDGPLTLDELPSCLLPEDQPGLAAAVTDCLVDGRPLDQEFRIVRPDGGARCLHMVGEPLLDDEGGTASMWAVLRDVSELRRTERTLTETRDSAQREVHMARTEHRVALELQETVLPPWRGSLRVGDTEGQPTGTLDLASHYLPSSTTDRVGGDWYDAMELPDGNTLLSAGDLTGHGVAAASGMTMLLGAVRGMAVAGVAPGALMGHLNQMLDSAAQPALGSAVCCRFAPATRTLTWAQAGHPAPLLFRGGTGRALRPPEGVLLGVTSGAAYGEHAEQLEPGDLLLLHTDGLAPRDTSSPPPGGAEEDEPRPGAERLLALAPRFRTARSAQECVRMVAEEFGDREREEDACVLVARISS